MSKTKNSSAVAKAPYDISATQQDTVFKPPGDRTQPGFLKIRTHVLIWWNTEIVKGHTYSPLQLGFCHV